MRRPSHRHAALVVVLTGTLLPATTPPGSTQPVAAQPGAPLVESEGFGRWESPLQRCELLWPHQGQQPSKRSPCVKVRVDQTIEGMLRVRFINGLGGSRYASEELTFAGLLLKQDQPMHCRSGSCQPIWPLRLQVHGVATRRFDPRGIADQLPHNQLARGNCRLEAQQLECEASNRGGQRWEAVAQLQTTASRQPSSNGNN